MIMLAQTMTHATLLERVSQSKDPLAWHDFCARYESLIRGFARRQGLQGADCDEVMQDVLMALTHALPEAQVLLADSYQKLERQRGRTDPLTQITLKRLVRCLEEPPAITPMHQSTGSV